jgi:hypothetical protein
VVGRRPWGWGWDWDGGGGAGAGAGVGREAEWVGVRVGAGFATQLLGYGCSDLVYFQTLMKALHEGQ